MSQFQRGGAAGRGAFGQPRGRGAPGAPSGPGGPGGQGVIDFLRANEAQLAALRAARPTLAPAPAPAGWAATKARLLHEACHRVQGSERSLAQEVRWGKLLIKMLHAVAVDEFATLGAALLDRATLVELSLHPHASLVIQALLRQLALLLALPDMSRDSAGRRHVRTLLQRLFSAGEALLAEDALLQLLPDAQVTHARARAHAHANARTHGLGVRQA